MRETDGTSSETPAERLEPYVDHLSDEAVGATLWQGSAEADPGGEPGDAPLTGAGGRGTAAEARPGADRGSERGDTPLGDAAGGDGGDDRQAAEALDVARRMEDDSERRPPVEAFESPDRWAADINAPGRDAPGRDYNCVFCSLATEQRWRGAPMRAGEWPHESGLTQPAAEKLVGPLADTSAPEIEQALRDAGPGSSGLVAMYNEAGGGHMMNVVNDNGTICWVDGQAGTVESDPWPRAQTFLWNARNREGERL